MAAERTITDLARISACETKPYSSVRPLCGFGWNGRIGRGPGSGAVPPGVENRADTADTATPPYFFVPPT